MSHPVLRRDSTIDWTEPVVPPPPEKKVYHLLPAWMKRTVRQRASPLKSHADSMEEVEYPFSFPTWPSATPDAPAPENPLSTVSPRTPELNIRPAPPKTESSFPSPTAFMVSQKAPTLSSVTYATPVTPRSPPPKKSVCTPTSPSSPPFPKERALKLLHRNNHESIDPLQLAHQASEQKLRSSKLLRQVKQLPRSPRIEISTLSDSQDLNVFLQSVLPTNQLAVPSATMLPPPLSPDEFYHALASYRFESDVILQNKLALACGEILDRFLASSTTTAEVNDLSSPLSSPSIVGIEKQPIISQMNVLDHFFHFLEELLQIRLRLRDARPLDEQHTLQLREQQHNHLIQRVLQMLCSVSVHWAIAASNSSSTDYASAAGTSMQQQAIYALGKCAEYLESYLHESKSYEVFSLLSLALHHLQPSPEATVKDRQQPARDWKSAMKWAIRFAKQIEVQQQLPLIGGNNTFSVAPFTPSLDGSALSRIEEIVYTCVAKLDLLSSPLDLHLSCIELQFMFADAQLSRQRPDSAKRTLLDCLKYIKHLWQHRRTISYSTTTSESAAEPPSRTSLTVSLPLLHAMQDTYFRLASIQLQMPKQLLYAVENFQSAIKVRRKFLSKQSQMVGNLEQLSTTILDQDATLQTYCTLLDECVSQLRTLTAFKQQPS